jgi:hypothetical protein
MQRSLLIFAVLVLGALGMAVNNYRDSFILLRNPLNYVVAGSGTVFYDQLRTQSGYNIINYYNRNIDCIIESLEGEVVITLPGGFCHIFPDGSLLTFHEGTGVMFDGSGILKWKIPVTMHHDLFVDEISGTFFVIIGDFYGSKETVRYDGVRGFDLDGNQIFNWELKDHIDEFERIVGEKIAPSRTNSGLLQFAHLNSVQIIPPNSLETEHPAFHRGNLLVNCWKYGILFILDRKTSKIIWSFRRKDDLVWRTHTPRITSKGKILLLANLHDTKDPDQNFSAIEMLDPLTRKIAMQLTAEDRNKFFTMDGGGVQLLDNGNFLVTQSDSGIAFEMTSHGRIVWQWNNPNEGPHQKPGYVYRVERVSKTRVEKVLKYWQNF